jgi:hypothetical protein
VAAASDRLAMPSEDWIQRWKAAQFLYDWQTLMISVKIAPKRNGHGEPPLFAALESSSN